MHRLWVLLRIAGALLILAAGAIHLWLYFDYFHRIHIIGVLFVLNCAAATIAGFALMLSAHPLAGAGGIAYSVGTLAGFFVSVYHGLFGYVERLSGGWQEAAGALEVAAIVVLVPLVSVQLGEWRQARRRAARALTVGQR
jgi:hypothetical protein